MSMFKIGQKVVCIDAKAKIGNFCYNPPPLIEGKIYIIKETIHCCETAVDVGIRDYISDNVCIICDTVFYRGNIHWCSSKRFVHLEDYEAMNEFFNVITEPESVEA